MNKHVIGLVGLAIVFSLASAEGGAEGRSNGFRVIDLTHVIPTFKPTKKDPTKADLTQPWLGSKPIPTFEKQAVLTTSRWPTNQGFFDLGALVLAEHHGTHVDAPIHYVNNSKSREPGGLPFDKLKMMHQVDAKALVGKIVLVDISGRIRKELAKNGGKPSPNLSVTDFSAKSGNVVTAQDIAAVEDKIENGVWLVVNLGWSQFFTTGEADWKKSPYVNNWNHPGLSRAAVDKLVEILDRKKVKISGIAIDNFGVASGQSSKGDDDKWSNSWREHVRLQQRQIMLLENAANLGELVTAINRNNEDCTLVVGAIKTTRGTGAPIRLLGLCQTKR